MLNSQEILKILHNYPKGYLEPHHDFFMKSNLNLFQTYKKLGAIKETTETVPECYKSTSRNNMFCNAFGCSATFDDTASYQSHYNATHRFICEECKKSFPTDHFLDLHISENHDSYFIARIERGERLFKCYLEECQEHFGNSQERKEHCLKHHRFPSNFRFDQMTCKASFKKHTSKKKAEQYKMEVDGESNSTNNKSDKFETISFGKQQEKTFYPNNGRNTKRDTGKTLNMNILTEVLDTI